MLKINIPRTWDKWAKAGLAAFISSGCNAGLASLGIVGAEMVGIKVPQLEWHQFLAISVSGGVIGLWMYLGKNPVPPDAGNTTIITKPNP